MDFKIVIKPIVIVDAEEAIKYYNKQSEKLGERFYQQFLTSLTEIQLNPLSYFYIKEPVRRYKMKKFPYKIYYLVSHQTIFILGVSHASRGNAFVESRLKF